MQTRTNRWTTRAIASIAALAMTGIAGANIIINYNSPSSYSYLVHKVPDFDQKRSVLPNDGKYYCVPTSALNWFAYIANHGYPNMAPGKGNWAGQGPYNAVSTNLLQMGFLMGTNPASGTGLSGAVAGMAGWLDASPYPGQFVVIGKNSDDYTSIRFDNLANLAMGGSLVMPRIGWYVELPGDVMYRDGGHVTTMTRASEAAGGIRVLGFNDPASDNDNLTTQSEFTREDYTCSLVFRSVNGTTRLVSRVNDYKAGKGGFKQGYIDGYRAIMPLFGLTTSQDNTSIVMKKPFAFGSAQPSEQSFSTGGSIRHLKLSSDALSAIVVSNMPQQNTSELKKLDFTTGQISTFYTSISSDIHTPIATSRFGDIYMLAPQTGVIRRWAPESGPKPQVLQLPELMTAITYDDFTDSVLLFAHQTRRLYRYPGKLINEIGQPFPPEIFQLPDSMSVFGDRQLVVSPVTGHIWYSTNASPNFWEIILPGDGSVIANPITAPNSTFSSDVSIDDVGYMYCCDLVDDIIRVYAPHQPGDGSVTLLGSADHPLADSPCRLRFAMVISRNNYDPATMDDPAQWDIEEPTEFSPSIPGCPADLDGDGTVGVVDLLMLLGDWGTPGFSDADLTFDGNVGVPDLLILLAAWGPCP